MIIHLNSAPWIPFAAMPGIQQVNAYLISARPLMSDEQHAAEKKKHADALYRRDLKAREN